MPAEQTEQVYEKREPETVPLTPSAEPFVADAEVKPAGQVVYTVTVPEET